VSKRWQASCSSPRYDRHGDEAHERPRGTGAGSFLWQTSLEEGPPLLLLPLGHFTQITELRKFLLLGEQ
jgi:hypothetical protein